MGKLHPLTIILSALAIGLGVLGYAFFQEWTPNKTEAQYQRDYAALLETEAGKMNQARRRVEQAEAMVNERAAAWNRVVATNTPPQSVATGGINLAVNGWQLTVDARRFRNNIQRAVNAQMRAGGVTVVQGPDVPFPDESASSILANYFNYPAIPFPVVIFDFGTVTVQGTYDQITEHVRSWSDMRGYLAVADGLALTGTSPNMTGTYRLSLIGYIRGNEIFPPVPEGAGGGAAPGGPGGPPAGFGGPPGGMPFGAPGRRGGGRMGA